MKPISTLKLSFITYLPRSQLYSNALNWMESNTLEYIRARDLWKSHYYVIFSTKENEEIKFGIYYATRTGFHRESNPAVIQFKQSPFSQVEIILDIPRILYLDSLNTSYPVVNHEFAHEILEAIFPIMPQKYLKTIYSEEFLNYMLWQEQNRKKAVYFTITLLLILPFVWDSILAKIISIIFLSAWLIDKYVLKTKPDPFYSEMKKQLYPDS